MKVKLINLWMAKTSIFICLIFIGGATVYGTDSIYVPSQSKASVLKTQKGPVSMKIVPQFGSFHKNDTQLNLLFRLKGEAVRGLRRAPLDLVMIIDRSSSMRGDKIRDAKVAAAELIKKLDSSDKVTLISYSSNVKTHFIRKNAGWWGRRSMKKEILAIKAGGMTALGPALYTGLNIFKPGQISKKRMSHIILFSDGRANTGETRVKILANKTAQGFRKGVSVSTIGVGLDYNEDLMTKIADHGGGRYHYIKKSSNTALVLNEEFKGLMATVARSIKLRIRPVYGLTVSKVYGYSQSNRGRYIEIKVGSLFGNQTRDIMIVLKRYSAQLRNISGFRTELVFNDVTADGAKNKHITTFPLSVTSDYRTSRQSEITYVTIRLAEVKAAETLEDATQLVQKNRYNKAKTMLKSSIVQLKKQYRKTPHKKLKKQIKEMDTAYKAVNKTRRNYTYKKHYVKNYKYKMYKKKK